MKVYFVFSIKEEFIKLYKGNERVLYNILKQIYYLEKEEAPFGYHLFKQLVKRQNKDELDRYLFLKLHQDIPYSKRGDVHYMNNLYKDEVSRLIVKRSYLKIEAEQNRCSFFQILEQYCKNYFVCNFKEQEFFFLTDICKTSKSL